jgi:hypothetical protein
MVVKSFVSLLMLARYVLIHNDLTSAQAYIVNWLHCPF